MDCRQAKQQIYGEGVGVIFNPLFGYVACVFLIGATILCARYNKFTGWVRIRGSFFQDLIELRNGWEAEDERLAKYELAKNAKAAVPAFEPHAGTLSPQEEVEFSRQLSLIHLGIDTLTIHPAVANKRQLAEVTEASLG
jgi:hypothetical protein